MTGFHMTQAFAQANNPNADYIYSGDMIITPDEGHISVDWHISVMDNKERVITFFVRNTLENIAVSGGGIESYSITSDKKAGGFHHINITLAPQHGDTARVINMSYDGELLSTPANHNINTISPNFIELNVDSFWHPIDNRFDKLIVAEMRIHLGPNWTGITTGSLTEAENSWHLENKRPALDIPFSFSQNFQVHPHNGFNIYDMRPSDNGLDTLITSASICFDYLNNTFGNKTELPTGRFLLTERSEGGYARGNYIALTEIGGKSPESLTQFVCHELAHFWSRNGNFGTVENWLNETFADYVANMALRDALGKDAFDTRMANYAEQIQGTELPPIWVREGNRERLPYLVNYRKGPLLLQRLEERIGAEKFHAFLYRYMVDGISNTSDLITALGTVAGQDDREWFEAELAK